MMKKILIRFIFLGLLYGTSPLSAEDRAIEHEYLARIIQELSLLEPLIQDAERYQPAAHRIQFNYAQLRQDIALIKQGIAARLTETYALPREWVQGDYVRDSDGGS